VFIFIVAFTTLSTSWSVIRWHRTSSRWVFIPLEVGEVGPRGPSGRRFSPAPLPLPQG
jgi:hypothetical protein